MAIRLAELESHFDDLDYPVTREAVLAEHGDLVIELAEGEMRLERVLSETDRDRYESSEDLHTAVENGLPREAVGEPYQSEGEG